MFLSNDVLVSAQKLLRAGKKRMSNSTCLDVTVQIMAVDLGIKPAVLYDSNGASGEQVQQFLNSLQKAGVVTNTLRTLSIGENTLVFNTSVTESHLNELLQNKSLLLMDVCPSRKHPVLGGFDKRTEDMIRTLLDFFNAVDRCSSVIVAREDFSAWNLCTLFGILLGFPAAYWFDQTKGFENCLCMTPLVVCTVWVWYQRNDVNHRCCLYSFSVPSELWSEAQIHTQQWTGRLKDRFSKQSVLTDLSFSMQTVTLPSVAL